MHAAHAVAWIQTAAEQFEAQAVALLQNLQRRRDRFAVRGH
jgi:hypothetical protein